MNEDKQFLGTAPIGKLLFKLAVPTVIAQIVNMMYNLVDRIFIGHIPEVGDLAITGVGVCLPVIMIITAFAALVASGSAPRASIAMGKGDYDTAEKILGSSVVLQFIISLILTTVLLIWNRPLLLAFGASENTIEYASGYMSIYAIGTLFVQLTLGLNAFITAQGFTKMGMITVMIGAVLNITLDPIFVFALDMGVKGAALATIISQCVSAVWCVIFLTGKKTHLKIKLPNLKLNLKLLAPCIALGTATFIMQASESVITVCFNSSLQKYGGDIAVGAMTICTSIFQFALLPLQGISQGAQPIASYNFGAKNMQRVRDTFKLLLTVCLSYAIVLWGFVMLFPGVFANMFTSKPELVEFAKPAIRTFCAGMFIMGAQMACQISFVSTGNAICSIIVAIVRKFVLLLPLIYIVPAFCENKTMGVYLAEPIADIIAVIFTCTLFAFQFNKSLKKAEKEPVLTQTQA